MEGNICSQCFELAIGARIRYMTTVANWDYTCTVCGKNLATFYAREDELKNANMEFKLKQ